MLELGQHVGVLEPPDLLVITFRGPIRVIDVVDYTAARDELLFGLPYLLTLIDLRGASGLEPECRRAIASIRDPRPQATAFFGGPFAFRVIAEMLAHASRLVAKRKLTVAFLRGRALGARLARSNARNPQSGLIS